MTTTTPMLDRSTVSAAVSLGAGLVRLLWTEIKLVLREPVVVIFVVAFPAMTVLILGGVFGPNDPSFEGIDPSQWFVAAYLGVVIAATGLIMLPVHVAGYRHAGVTRRFRVSRFPPWALPLTQMLLGVVMIGIGLVVLMIVAHLSYGIPPIQDPATTAVGAVFGSLAFISLGVMLGSLFPTPRAAQGVGMLIFFPSFLLGGGGPPPDAMGPAMRTLSTWTPLTHVIRAVQEPWLDLDDPTGHLAVTAGLLVASTIGWVAATRRDQN
jgi:ABC-2 type transport system permease protein